MQEKSLLSRIPFFNLAELPNIRQQILQSVPLTAKHATSDDFPASSNSIKRGATSEFPSRLRDWSTRVVLLPVLSRSTVLR